MLYSYILGYIRNNVLSSLHSFYSKQCRIFVYLVFCFVYRYVWVCVCRCWCLYNTLSKIHLQHRHSFLLRSILFYCVALFQSISQLQQRSNQFNDLDLWLHFVLRPQNVSTYSHINNDIFATDIGITFRNVWFQYLLPNRLSRRRFRRFRVA